MIDYEQDRVQSVTQTDAAKSLSDKVIELKNLEDEIENAEESLSKLKENSLNTSELIPILGSANNTSLLEKVLEQEKVEVIFHTAAYKHVPLVEVNPLEGLKNSFKGFKQF